MNPFGFAARGGGFGIKGTGSASEGGPPPPPPTFRLLWSSGSVLLWSIGNHLHWK